MVIVPRLQEITEAAVDCGVLARGGITEAVVETVLLVYWFATFVMIVDPKIFGDHLASLVL